MTVEHFCQSIAPHVKWPIKLRLEAWLEPDMLFWSRDMADVLVAGERAYAALKEKFPPV